MCKRTLTHCLLTQRQLFPCPSGPIFKSLSCFSHSPPVSSLSAPTYTPVSREAHGKNGGHIQVSRLVYNTLCHHSAPFIHNREEDELYDVLRGGDWGLDIFET